MPDNTDVKIALTHEEALVLFDFLQRQLDLMNGVQLKPIVKHDGELWALNGLNCLLERELVEPFRPDYEDIMSRALASIVERNGIWPE